MAGMSEKIFSPEQHNPNTKYAHPHMPSLDIHTIIVSKSYMPLYKHTLDQFAKKLYGEKLLAEFEALGLREEVMRSCRHICPCSKKRRDRDGLYNENQVLPNEVLHQDKLNAFVKQICNEMLAGFLRPTNVDQFSSFLSMRLLRTQPRKEILTRSDLRNKSFGFFSNSILTKIEAGAKTVDITSALNINTAHFVIMIILGYLDMYFDISFDEGLKVWKYVRREPGRDHGKADWIKPSVRKEKDANTSMNVQNASFRDEAVGVNLKGSALKSSVFYLKNMNAVFDRDFYQESKTRIPLLMGKHAFDKFPKLAFYDTLDFYVSQLLKFLPRYDGIIANYQAPSSSKAGTIVPKTTVQSFVLSFLQISPQKWLSPTNKSATETLATVLTERLETWKVGAEDFCSGHFVLNNKYFDFFADNHAEDLPSHCRDEILAGLAYHTFRLLCAILLRAITNTFSFWVDANSLILYFKNKTTQQTQQNPERRSLNSDSPTVLRKRTLLEVDTRSEHVEIVESAPTPKKEKICITIDDDPIQDKKPNLVELKRRMSQQSQEEEQEKENVHVFDPKRVKMEKNLETSKKTEEVPEKVEDILIDKIDFLKFKTDIDSDQNILSIYKTIFGLALESREELRSRCIALMKENSCLKEAINSLKI